MALCGSCGAETTRIRTTFHQGGTQSDECDKCKPNSFDPQWLKARLAAGYEAFPHLYKKTTDDLGRTIYVSTEERQADLAAKIAARPKDEVEAERKALEKKRRERRTAPLSQAEIDAAQNKWGPVVRAKREEREKEVARAKQEWLT